MKKTIYFILGLISMNIFSCNEDKEVGIPIEIIEDYKLPQGNASVEANARIQEIYETYDSYVLYNYTQKDALWKQAAGTGAVQKYVISMGDVQYVDAMLNYIDAIWLQFFPPEFLKKGGLPYRVFLADSIYLDRSTPQMTRLILYNYMLNGNSVAISGMNANLTTMNAETKRARKLELITAMWDYYIAEGILDIPEEFYDGTDYNTAPELPLTEKTLDTYIKRGFLPSRYYGDNYAEEWYVYPSSWKYAVTNDLKSFLYHLFSRSDEQMEIYLNNSEYKLIQNKWNVLINYYKEKYNIDIRKIGNTTYE